MTSKREQVLDAVKRLIEDAMPGADVKRNRDKPQSIPAGGMVIVRDGDCGQPDVILSPLLYIYDHRIPLEVATYQTSGGATREEALDRMLMAIGNAILADRTLGGLCDFLECEAPATDDIEAEGARTARWADVAIVATYGTSNPLL